MENEVVPPPDGARGPEVTAAAALTHEHHSSDASGKAGGGHCGGPCRLPPDPQCTLPVPTALRSGFKNRHTPSSQARGLGGLAQFWVHDPIRGSGK